MKFRLHPTYKTHYRGANWREYERGLVSRGDVTLWLSPAAKARGACRRPVEPDHDAHRSRCPAPHTTLSRRTQSLDVAVHNFPVKGPLHLIVDSTGVSVIREGEWAAAKYRGRGVRGWKQLHMGVDRAGVIVAHALTDATVDDAIPRRPSGRPGGPAAVLGLVIMETADLDARTTRPG